MNASERDFVLKDERWCEEIEKVEDEGHQSQYGSEVGDNGDGERLECDHDAELAVLNGVERESVCR